jgi:hypothetical protein
MGRLLTNDNEDQISFITISGSKKCLAQRMGRLFSYDPRADKGCLCSKYNYAQESFLHMTNENVQFYF